MIPALKEILPKLSGAKYFSIVNAKCGYWNVELDQEPSYLTAFNSHLAATDFCTCHLVLRFCRMYSKQR